MTVTYVDAGILIAANRSRDALGLAAINVLTDARRKFVSSFWLRLEVEPKSVFHKQAAELAFYATFFEAVERWALPTSRLAADAFELAARHGLAALDALHVGAAISLAAEEFVTAEHPGKPVFRVPGIRVLSIRPPRAR